MCLHSRLTHTKESPNWSAGVFGALLHYIASVWFQQCKVQSVISLEINPICHPFLLTNETLNLLSSRKRPLIAEQQVLILSWRRTKIGKKSFFPYESFDYPDKMQNTEFPRMTRFTGKFAAVILLKQNTKIRLVFWEIEWTLNKLSSSWSYQSHCLQERRTIKTWNKIKAAINELILGFLRWYNYKYVAPTLETMQKDRFLPGQGYRYVKAWLYLTKPSNHLSTQVYIYEVLSLHGGRY